MEHLPQEMTRTDAMESRLAGYLCVAGFLLHMVLSDPLLRALGVNYSGEEGHFYEKIHPGTALIFLSLLVVLLKHANPAGEILAIIRRHTAFASLFCVYVLAFFYMVARSGFAGLAFIIDCHMAAVICAIVLSYAPLSLCRKAVHMFVSMGILNALLGIAEAVFRFRLFDYNQGWYVLQEDYFRASAFMGHPLDNAIFTSVAVFVVMAMPYGKLLKALAVSILLLSLLAFGGRSALLFSFTGMAVLACAGLKGIMALRQLSLMRVLSLAAFTVAGIACFAAVICYALKAGLGERIMASAFWDKSADSRRLVFMVFRYMTPEEILFGVSPQRVMDIVYRMNLVIPLVNIENPWIMMLMQFGAILFSFWFLATLAFIRALIKHQSLALQMAVIAYFAIASTSNSFGRKDPNYAIMVCAVVCAGRSMKSRESTDQSECISSPPEFA